MISQKRKDWINERRKRGDISETVRNLQHKGFSISYSAAKSIVLEGVWGENGPLVWNELEKIIRKRYKQLEKENSKYATAAA